MADIHTLDIARQRDDELLSRLIDGECSADERIDLEERLAANAELRARLETFRSNDAYFRKVTAARDHSVGAHITNHVATSPAKGGRTFAPAYKFAMAASLVLATAAVMINSPWNTPLSNTPQIDSTLAQALDTAPSRAEGWNIVDDDRALRVVLTFPAADGQWCREFMLASDASHWRGVACKGSESWVTQVIGREVFLEQQGGYRTASAAVSHPIEQFIDQTATDIALSGDEEAALIARDWAADSGL